MALPKLEAFTDADSTLLTTHDAGWQMSGVAISPQILGNALACNGTGTHVCLWTTDTFPNDQYAQAVVTVVGSSSRGPAARGTVGGSNTNGYAWRSGSATVHTLEKIVAGTTTTLFTDSLNDVVNDVLRIETVGTTIRGKLNGVNISGDITDSAFASGSAGVCTSSANTAGRIDDWEGGSLVVALYSQPPLDLAIPQSILLGQPFNPSVNPLVDALLAYSTQPPPVAAKPPRLEVILQAVNRQNL